MSVRPIPVSHLEALVPTRAERYNATSFEAFSLGTNTRLLDPLEAGTLNDALAETTGRWSWDRGDRLAVREISLQSDRLHVYAVRKKSAGQEVWRSHVPSIEHRRWLEHICTVDLDVIAGIPNGLIGCEIELHARRQAMRPDGAAR